MVIAIIKMEVYTAMFTRSNLKIISLEFFAVLTTNLKKNRFMNCSVRYLAAALVLMLGGVQQVLAEPYLAVKTNNKCSACHVNPIGGGARNDYGAYYGAKVLPEVMSSATNFDPGRATDSVRLGGDLRVNFSRSDTDDADSQSFNTETGQIYIAVQPKESRFLFYLDQQIAPGAAFSREAFIQTKLNANNYLKVGKLMLPYGLRLEDDSAFIRQATQVNFDNSDNGVELGFEFAKATVNVAFTNGTARASNDDEEFQYALRAEYLGHYWRIGSSALINDAELGTRSMFNVFGGFSWNGYGIMAEIDHIEDESIVNVNGESEVKLAAFLELNKEFAKGYNLKLTTEFLDPDDDIEENERVRHSMLVEYTPFANFQVRGGLRNGDDIPQRNEGNFTDMFIQAHMYF